MTDWAGNRRMRIGWWLMGVPTGYSEPWLFLLRFGPYRLGAMIYDWGAKAHDKWLEENG